MAPSRKSTALVLAILVLATAVLRFRLLDIPFERDEGEYAYIAWRLEHGELPYRDWVDQKPPGVFWVYRAALALPMPSIRAVHFMGMLWAAASACALFLLSRRFLGYAGAAAAGALFALVLSDPAVQGTAANTELFMLLPLILAQIVFFAVTDGGRPRWLLMLLCGALTGLAVAFKQVAGVNWLFLAALLPFFVPREMRLSDALGFAGWSAIGAAGVFGVIVAYFALRGGLEELVHHVFTHNLQYVSALSWPARWEQCLRTLRVLSDTQAVLWLLSAVGLLALWVTGRKALFLYLAGWLAASAIGVSASGYYFPHYFQQLLPALALAAVVGARWLWGLRAWRGVPAPARTAVLAAALVVQPALGLRPYLFEYTPEEAVERIYPMNPFAVMPEIGARLAELTAPEDKVFVFGAEPELLFYARRVSATRYIFLFPLYGPYADALEKQTATAEEITRARPAAALYFPNRLFSMPGSEQHFTRWSEAYLDQNFRVDTYMAVDTAGHTYLLPSPGGRAPGLPHGHFVFGALLVRSAR